MDSVARRVVVVVGLLLLVPAIIIALLPASVSGSVLGFSYSVGCNPAAIARVYDDTEAVNGSYDPAILVWISPKLVVPAGIPLSDVPDVTGACGAAAQQQMVPAVILGGISVFLLIFGGLIVRYIWSGNTRQPYAPTGPTNPSVAGWYPSPENDRLMRWWDGQRWTADTLDRQQ